jgi:hypothetical protein
MISPWGRRGKGIGLADRPLFRDLFRQSCETQSRRVFALDLLFNEHQTGAQPCKRQFRLNV